MKKAMGNCLFFYITVKQLKFSENINKVIYGVSLSPTSPSDIAFRKRNSNGERMEI